MTAKPIILTALISSSYLCQAQENLNFIFSHLTTLDGLSNNIVNYITQDSSGFIWLATVDGLDRYDGKHFKIYRNDPLHPNSLPNNTISYISIEKNGLLWISTADGLCSLDSKTDSFTIYKNIASDTNSLSHNYQPVPFIDHNNELWVGTAAGLNYFDRKKKSFTRYLLGSREEIQKNSLVSNVRRIYEDKQQRLWVLSYEYLYLFNRVNRSFQRFASVKGPMFYDLLQKNDSVFYIATWGQGLWEFNKDNKGFSKIELQQGTNSIIMCIADSYIREKHQVLAGSGNGLLFMSPEKNDYVILQHDIRLPGSIIDDNILNIFVDRQNIIWIGTGNGISRLNPQMQLFFNPGLGDNLYPGTPEKYGEPNGFIESDSNYWVGPMFDKGLFLYDKNWKLQGRLRKVPPYSKSPGSGNIYSMYRENNCIWYCTDSGLVQYDESLKKYHVFLPPAEPDGNVFGWQMRKVIPWKTDCFILRTWDAGIYIFNKKTGTFESHFQHHADDAGSLADNNVQDIVKNSRNEIYVSTVQGLSEFHPGKGNFTTYLAQASTAGLNNLMGKTITDSAGNLWISSPQGLFFFNSVTKKFTRFTTADGLATSHIKRTCFDNHGKLWLATILGISRFDPVSKQVLNFSVREGLPVSYFDGTLLKSRDGHIVAGYVGGLILIDPDNYPFNKTLPPVAIAEIKVQDKLFSWQLNASGQKQIRLKYSQNELNIAFAVLNFTSSGNNQYYYKLGNFDTGWRQSPDGFITYTNLSPGQYLLRVKGANNSGVMNEAGDTLQIIITPPFWQTWWFRFLVLGLICLLLYVVVRRRIEQVRKEGDMKKQILETEMMALRAQMNPHFIFNCLTSIDNLIQTDEKEKATVYLAKFARLIRAILENSKQDVVPCWKDIETLQLYLELEELRWNNKFEYLLQVDEKIWQGDYKIPPMIIQPFVENAIHHGLLNKVGAGNRLIISIQPADGYIKYTVEDNGVGRLRAEEYKKLNKPAHQSLGMHITSERIHLFNGQRNGSVTITDLYDELNQPTGTRVEVLLTNQP